MIHHLHGRLVEKHPTHVVVECGGVGYFVAISLTTFDQLGDHELVKIHTHMGSARTRSCCMGLPPPRSGVCSCCSWA